MPSTAVLATLSASPFVEDLCTELVRAQQQHAPLHSLHEAWAVIVEEVDELWDEVRRQGPRRSNDIVYRELLQIAAMCWRTALDLRLARAAPLPEEIPHADPALPTAQPPAAAV